MSVLTGEAIQQFRHRTILVGLSLEAKGMRHSTNSVAKAARAELLAAGKPAPANKVKLHAAYKAHIEPAPAQVA